MGRGTQCGGHVNQRMSKKDLKLRAEDVGVDHRWKSKKRLRKDVSEAMGITPLRRGTLKDLHTCRGVRKVEEGVFTVTLHHKWWGWPFARSNVRMTKEYMPAGIQVNSNVDFPWPVIAAIVVTAAACFLH